MLKFLLLLGLVGATGDSAVESCLDSSWAAERVERNRVRGVEAGVRGTPTYFIDGFPAMGAVPYGFVKRIFDGRLGGGAGG